MYRRHDYCHIHTDDPAFFHTTLEREHEIAEKTLGLPTDELAANSFRYALGAAEITSPSNSS